MTQDTQALYSELVDNWSKLYIKKVGGLFTFEELQQEVWLAIQTAEDYNTYDSTKGATKKTYLSACIKGHLIDLIVEAIERRTVEGSIIEEVTPSKEENVPSDLTECYDLYQKLETQIEKIPHASLVLKYMPVMTVRDISKKLEGEGIIMKKSTVQNVITTIRHELEILLEEEEV